MANKYIKIGVWVLSSLLAAAAHTETESTPADGPVKTPTPAAFSDALVVPAISETASPEIVPNANYIAPRFDKPLGSDIYPHEEMYKAHEGWVQLNMMVDKQGKPYEISVVDSTGNPVFDKAATRIISNYQFRPATLNGEPVDADFMLKFTFGGARLGKGASKAFGRGYNALISAEQHNDRAAADEALKLLKVQNLYEDAFYSFGRFYYYQLWGDNKQQLQALQRAIAYEYKAKFLPTKDFQAALAELFQLQIRTKDFAAALQTFNRFDATKKNDPSFLQAVASIKALANDANAYSVRGEITTGTSWSYSLLKRHFSILVLEGEVAEIKLRCERKYVLIRYQPDKDYATSDDYGACNMELVGSNGTQFTLIQS